LLYAGLGVLHTGELCITTDDPVFYPNGIPTNASGQVCVTSSPTLPVYFSGGLKFDATGRLVVTGTASVPAQYNSGFQFDTDGALVAVPGSLYSVSISGTPEVGQVLTAVLVGTGGSGFTYQWTRNGVDIGGATSSTYTVVLADEGTTIRVVVTYTVIDTGLPETITSGGVAIPVPPPPAGWTVLDASGTSYTVAYTAILDGAGTSYSCPQAVLDGAGTSYTPV
jgi:hypothetical protein